MSTGLVICSTCKREVHQGAGFWYHCEDRSPRCELASSVYPKSLDEIVGKYCGMDGSIGADPPAPAPPPEVKVTPMNRHARRAIAAIERKKRRKGL